MLYSDRFAMLKMLVLICAFSCSAYPVSAGTVRSTEILWDNYGVPHIFGRNIEEMYYGFGWAQMHNHADLILRLYGQARGRAAEYWGDGYLLSDEQICLFDIPKLAENALARQNPEFLNYLNAFVKGVNDYTRTHQQEISNEYKVVLPVTSKDVLAHVLRVLFLEFVASEDIGITSNLLKAGSNAYAIGPSRAKAKHAMLVSNPHLLWGDFYIFFEAHLNAPGFNAYGASLVGMPVLNIAFNDHLGWTHTVNTIDATDRYELTLKDGGYLLDSTVLPFSKRTVVFKIRQPDGTFKEQTMEFRYSVHGPILGDKDGKAYSVRIAGLEDANMLLQWHLMAKSTNLDQFRVALKMMQFPMFNVIYADAAGNIFYLFDGNVPKRSTGDWQFWHGEVDGSVSKYIWHNYLSYEDLPKLLNPASGFLQNANDPPWNCTYPEELDPEEFPTYISPVGMDFRPQRAVDMIKDDYSITFQKLIDYKLNTGMEVADRFLNELYKAAARYPDSIAVKAVNVLKKWDILTDSNSRGAVLFANWFDRITPDMFITPWQASSPIETPCGLKDYKRAVELLIAAAKEVEKVYGNLDVAWGDVYRFRMNGSDYAANGASGKYGVFRTFYYVKDNDNKYRAIAGDSYVAVTEFGKRVRARVLLSYGNATQPGNKHVGDQLLLLSQKRMRIALLSRKEILRNLEKEEKLNINL